MFIHCCCLLSLLLSLFFFFNDPPTTEIYTLSLHHALPISFSLFRRTSSLSAHPTAQGVSLRGIGPSGVSRSLVLIDGVPLDRKSTRLNSSHSQISYAVFCLKKKNKHKAKSSSHRYIDAVHQ